MAFLHVAFPAPTTVCIVGMICSGGAKATDAFTVAVAVFFLVLLSADNACGAKRSRGRAHEAE